MAETDAEEGEEKKSSKKLFIIIAIVVLLAGGGGAGYYFMAGDSEVAEGEQAEEGDEEEEEEPEEEEEGEADNQELYYELKQPLIVNFPKGKAASLIQVSVSVLVKGEQSIEALKKHEPMIRNNFLMLISGQDPKTLMTKEGKVALRETMLTEIGKIMEKMTQKNKIKNIFFTAFVMQ